MKFNSQICTSREQSERLLALGLKKETADMHWAYHSVTATRYMVAHPCDGVGECIPAWALHWLIEMMPEYVHKGNANFERTLFPNSIDYFRDLYKDCGDVVISFDSPNLYDRLIHCIEWLIKEGYFPKEYLVNQAEIEEHCKGVLEYLDYIREEE